MPISPARVAAFQILKRVETDGGYASDLIARATQLDSRDAGLASQIVYGCLRYMAQLDYLALRYASRKSLKLDVAVSIALRMGIFQIRHLDRVPIHAAVSESVELVKWAGKRSAAGLVNAILRKANREPVEWPDREKALSCPEWLLTRWSREYGEDAAKKIALAALEEPKTYLRGARVQDIGSQSVVPWLELKAGESFLDVCAAPGNKTAQALETPIHAVASDIHMHRLNGLRTLSCPLVQLDAEKPLPFKPASFDKILVDVPCSGTGTLGRNPEIKWRLIPDDVENLAPVQRAILRNALNVLKPGGRAVYSTCSLEPQENKAVVDRVLALLPEFSVVSQEQRLPGREEGDGFYTAVIARSGS
jgi:16S rRNA (cytosine967-C5)-methyltransferase